MNNDIAATAEATTSAIALPPYEHLTPVDAVALLNERLAAEADAFTHATGLKLAAVKVKRDKESDDYRLECHVRS